MRRRILTLITASIILFASFPLVYDNTTKAQDDIKISKNVVVERGATWNKYRNPDGTYTLETSIGQINYEDEHGFWHPIDTTLVSQPDGTLVVDKAPYKLVFFANHTGYRVYPDRNNLSAWIDFYLPDISIPKQNKKFYKVITPKVKKNKWCFESEYFDINISALNTQVRFEWKIKDKKVFNHISKHLDMTIVPHNTDILDNGFLKSFKNCKLINRIMDKNHTVKTPKWSFDKQKKKISFSIDDTGLSYPIVIDPSLEVNPGVSENDGYVYGGDSSYSTAHDTASTYSSDGNLLYFGQDIYSGNYYIFRTFLKFDTSSIPSSASITDAKLKLYGYNDLSTTDFYVRLQKWTGDTPIDTGDYNQFDGINYDAGNFSTSSFTEDAYNIIYISNYNLVTKGGYTKICIRSDRDISETIPTNSEYVYVTSYDYGDANKYPLLNVTYSTVPSNTKPTISNPSPVNQSTNIDVPPDNFSITISDADDDTMNITWEENSTGTWKTFNTTNNVGNGTYYVYNTSWVTSYDTKYWWRVNVSDRTDYNVSIFWFETKEQPSGWWNTDWQYYKILCIDANGYSGFYQMCLNVSYSSGGNVSCEGHCQSDFDDIRFVDIDNSTVLPYWRETYVDSQYAIIWVNVSADAMSDGRILMYYGNPSASSASDGDDTFIYYNDGTKTTGFTTWGGSPSITTDGDYLDIHPTTDERVRAYTGNLISEGALLKVRYKQYGTNVNAQRVFFCHPSETDFEYNSLGVYDADKWDYWRFRSEKDGTASYNSISGLPDFYNFHIYETAWFNDDGTDTGKFWYDGALKSTKTDNIPTTDMYVGVITDYPSNGLLIDYIIVRKYTSPEPSWSSFGSEQAQGGWTNTPPSISNPSPVNGSTGVMLQPTVSVQVNDSDGNQTEVWLYTNETGSWVLRNHATFTDGNGTITYNYVNASSYDTTYYWKVCVTDGENWNNQTFHFTTTFSKLTEDFEDDTTGGNPSESWYTYSEVTDAGNPTVSGADSHSGNKSLYFEDPSGSGHETIIFDLDFFFNGSYVEWYWNVSESTDLFSPKLKLYDDTLLQNFEIPSKYNADVSGGLAYHDGSSWHTFQKESDGSYMTKDLFVGNWTRMRLEFNWTDGTMRLTVGDTASKWVSMNPVLADEGGFNRLIFDSTYAYTTIAYIDDLTFSNIPLFNEITISNPQPANGATNVELQPSNLSITVSNEKGYLMNITWKEKSSDTWKTFNTTSNVGNGTYYAFNTSWISAWGTTYYWKVVVDDGHNNTAEQTFSFTTRMWNQTGHIHISTYHHQGIIRDENYYYIIDTSKITKYDASLNAVAQNTNPHPPNRDHLGDGDIYGDYLYVADKHFSSCSDYGYPTIVVYYKSNLTMKEYHSVTPTYEISGLSIWNGTIYTTSCCEGQGTDKIYVYMYNLSDFSYIGQINFTFPSGLTRGCIQSVEVCDEFFFFPDDCSGCGVWVFDHDGNYLGKILKGLTHHEGVDWSDNDKVKPDGVGKYNLLAWDGGGYDGYFYDCPVSINDAPTVSNPSPSDGATDVEITLSQLSIDISDPDGDTFNWSIETSPNIGSASGDNENNGTKTCSLSGLNYGTTYTWYVNVTDGFDWTNQTYSFTTRNAYTPANPSDFSAATDSRFQITLTWTKGTNTDKTVIVYKTTDYPTSVSDGTTIYNDTGTSYSHTGLTPGTTYYYSAWSWNNTDNVYSSSYTTASATTLSNNPPSLTNLSASPSSGVADYTTFYFNITYSDSDGDNPTVIKVNISKTGWYTNVSMTWISGDNTTGALYSYSTTLSAGTYDYLFYASDGTDSTTNDPTAQVTVNAQSYSFTVSTSDPAGKLYFNASTVMGSEWNVSASYQTSSIPAINITNTGNVPIKINATLNTTPISNVHIKYNLTYNPPTFTTNPYSCSKELTTSNQTIVSSIPVDGYQDIFLWADFENKNNPGSYDVTLTFYSSLA